MIANIIELLNSGKHYGISNNIEIAKGKNEIVYRWKDGIEKIKRLWLIRKSKSK